MQLNIRLLPLLAYLIMLGSRPAFADYVFEAPMNGCPNRLANTRFPDGFEKMLRGTVTNNKQLRCQGLSGIHSSIDELSRISLTRSCFTSKNVQIQYREWLIKSIRKWSADYDEC